MPKMKNEVIRLFRMHEILIQHQDKGITKHDLHAEMELQLGKISKSTVEKDLYKLKNEFDCEIEKRRDYFTNTQYNSLYFIKNSRQDFDRLMCEIFRGNGCVF